MAPNVKEEGRIEVHDNVPQDRCREHNKLQEMSCDKCKKPLCVLCLFPHLQTVHKITITHSSHVAMICDTKINLLTSRLESCQQNQTYLKHFSMLVKDIDKIKDKVKETIAILEEGMRKMRSDGARLVADLTEIQLDIQKCCVKSKVSLKTTQDRIQGLLRQGQENLRDQKYQEAMESFEQGLGVEIESMRGKFAEFVQKVEVQQYSRKWLSEELVMKIIDACSEMTCCTTLDSLEACD
jgi:hypothetical protein